MLVVAFVPLREQGGLLFILYQPAVADDYAEKGDATLAQSLGVERDGQFVLYAFAASSERHVVVQLLRGRVHCLFLPKSSTHNVADHHFCDAKTGRQFRTVASIKVVGSFNVKLSNQLGISERYLRLTTVAHLLRARCPAAIAWFVVAMLIRPAIWRVLRSWSPSHIGQKGRKRLAPTITDRDATTTVVSKIFPVWVVAALHHIRPLVILRQMTQAVHLDVALGISGISDVATPDTIALRLIAQSTTAHLARCAFTNKIGISHLASYLGRWLGSDGAATSSDPLCYN